MIHSPQKIETFAVKFDENLIQMPLLLGMAPCSLPTNFFYKLTTKTIDSNPDCFVANIEDPLVKDVFNLSKTQRKTHLILHRHADDLRARFEIFEDIGLGRLQKLWTSEDAVKFL